MNFESYLNQDYKRLKRQLLQSGQLFEDPEFPADQSSIYQFTVPNHVLYNNITWKRPHEIISNPKFIENCISPDDLYQGQLGDCWFIAGAVLMATVPDFLKIVVPDDQSFEPSSYCGMFHFRFWRFGKWVEVVVDDRLPVDDYNKLVYCSNKKYPNEFWCALIEKAYAKVNGCYEFLEGGFTQDAVVDLTGGVSESFNIQKIVQENKQELLWSFIKRSANLKSLSSAGILNCSDQKEPRLPNGLVMGHAYSITKFAVIEPQNKYYHYMQPSLIRRTLGEISRPVKSYYNDDNIKLLRLRNPWGNEQEWNGPWSDNSFEWNEVPQSVKEDLGIVNDVDGDFWMEFKDFLDNFTELEFVHVNMNAFYSESISKSHNMSKWITKQYKGEWIVGKSAGGSQSPDYWSNPQYMIRIKNVDPYDEERKATLIVSLMTQDNQKLRLKNEGNYFDFPKQFRVYKVNNVSEAKKYENGKAKFNSNQLTRVDATEYLPLREVSKRFRLDPGYYVIIPSTYDKNVQLKFLLRLFTENKLVDASHLDKLNPQPQSIDDNDSNDDPSIDLIYDDQGKVVPANDWIDYRDDWPSGYEDDVEKKETDKKSNKNKDEWPEDCNRNFDDKDDVKGVFQKMIEDAKKKDIKRWPDNYITDDDDDDDDKRMEKKGTKNVEEILYDAATNELGWPAEFAKIASSKANKDKSKPNNSQYCNADIYERNFEYKSYGFSYDRMFYISKNTRKCNEKEDKRSKCLRSHFENISMFKMLSNAAKKYTIPFKDLSPKKKNGMYFRSEN